jgi:NAD(P)H-hydrate epimerase
MMSRLLVSSRISRAIDEAAQNEWGLNAFALVEAAGRSCAKVFAEAYPRFFDGRTPRITAAAGSGNNGADALVMLRGWILAGLVDPALCVAVLSKLPATDEKSPFSEVVKSLRRMNVFVTSWYGDIAESAGRFSETALTRADIIIDGVSGTGVKGALSGTPEEMVAVINALRAGGEKGFLVNRANPVQKPFVVSVDIPSGLSDDWKPGMPIVDSDVTLVIEPQKACLYNPPARIHSGRILPVGEVFPAELVSGIAGADQSAELLCWDEAKQFLPPIRLDAYKHERGTAEIRAGAAGTTGAAIIAARGAQAAGAGLVRLIVDDELYPAAAAGTGGIMVVPVRAASEDAGRFKSDAVLLGPGWGKTADRAAALEKALERETLEGTPVILDADAIALAKNAMFHGKVILTPHPGEFAVWAGISMEEALNSPWPVLRRIAEEKQAVVILKGHVLTIASFDGRWGIIDGMAPGLSAGGSGDLLAGFCAALAARMARLGIYDGFRCAAAAASLLIAAGKSEKAAGRFSDPLELADIAAELAGRAWLPQEDKHGKS